MRIRPLSVQRGNLSAVACLTISLCVLGCLCVPGCSQGDPDAASNPPAGGAVTESGDSDRSVSDPSANGVDATSAQRTAPPTTAEREELAGPRIAAADSADPAMAATGPGSNAGAPNTTPPSFELAESNTIPAGIPEMIGTGGANAVAAERELRGDLTADELMTFLEESDRDMEMLARQRNQLQDADQANEMMQQLVKGKLQAAVRLLEHPNATDAQRTAGLRGQLQALSHLSAMGDIQSAKALEALAKQNLSSPESTIASDSRIVLIGFAIDGLRAGRESAAQEIVSLIQGMTASATPDIPAVLMMAEARQVLADYGLVDQSAKVREKILELYGNSPDKMIAQVAADAAGTAKYDSATRLIGEILENENVALERWTEAVTTLTGEAPDMNTVEFLGTSALQFEAAGRDAFVQETFRILSERFADADSATAGEIATAKAAMEARRDVIGTSLDALAHLPTLDGNSISSSHTKGKVVLMPFWAVMIPPSLQIIPMLQEIQSRHPDKIAIVGMNLDGEQAPLGEFLAKNDLGFPSYRSVSSATSDQGNPIASKFGLVSLPFVAIFNQQGKVEALDFTGLQLESVVESLIDSEN
ncbi:Sporulation thiol-disulfide oxidoreductase A precursor [Stieleria maiorica]|uniref:Sporulation thiol-disulfide oxidoreductase A n=1 Tax=Stieleria maiorica TaxID=2795974 RepID=A0A5B9MBX9_9BACT|nr:thioredoxin-like domain-containing protein [Stieleria maiorica]QEF97706.1 Sporulation thiol-disulfide oxidoreductase A precursor [Stieleria maiorica]